MITTPLNELFFYIRIIIFPLCALGFVTSAVYEYQNGKSKLRLAVMIFVAISMLAWMTMTIAAVSNPSLMEDLRMWVVTPIVTILTVMIWTYAITRTKRKKPFIKEISEREKIQ
jgi:magnesium-transporting ATPase (P-type)